MWTCQCVSVSVEVSVCKSKCRSVRVQGVFRKNPSQCFRELNPRIRQRCANRICGIMSTKCVSGDIQPTSHGPQAKSNGLQSHSDGLQPDSNGLQPHGNALQIAMAFNLMAMASNKIVRAFTFPINCPLKSDISFYQSSFQTLYSTLPIHFPLAFYTSLHFSHGFFFEHYILLETSTYIF